MLELYRNIRKYRKENEWSQTELAKRVGYADKSMISRIENGKVDLPLNQIKAFAAVFGVTPSELMGRDGIDNDLELFSLQTVDHLQEYFKNNPDETEMSGGGRKIIIVKKPTVLSDEEKKIVEAYRDASDAIQCAVKKLLDIGGDEQ